MYNLTLQNAGGDSVITSGDVLGRISFAVPSESDGTAATYIASQIYCQAEGSFTSASNPASVIISTSSSDAAPATGRLKISQDGHVVPIASGQYDLGSAASLFRNAYVNTGNVNVIFFNTSLQDPNLSQGQLQWNSTEGTLDLGFTDTYAQHIGEELHYRVRNNTSSILTKGTAVYASGLTPGGNNRIEIAPFTADGSVREVRFMGLVTENISNGVNGYATQFGYIRGIDTRGDASSNGYAGKLWDAGEPSWSEGDILYAHPTAAGKLTKVEPKHSISVAIILNRHQNQGKIFVRPTSYGHLSDNHDVNISGVSNGQFLQYNSSTDYWVPSSSGNFTSLQVNSTAVPTGTGASNYVTKWTGTNSLGTGIIYDDGTSVGIGTSSPSSKLDVSGIITATSGNSTNWNTAYSWGDHSTSGYLTDISSQNIQDLNNVISDFSYPLLVDEYTIIYDSGISQFKGSTINLGLIRQGIIPLAGYSTSYLGYYIRMNNGEFTVNEQGDNLNFRVEGNTVPSLLFTDAIADSVGIGTNTPAAPLHLVRPKNAIYGSVLIQDSTPMAQNVGGSIVFGGIYTSGNDYARFGQIAALKQNSTDGNTKSVLSFVTNDGSAFAERMRILPSGNVAIGSTGADSHRLSVRGNINANNAIGIYSDTAYGSAATAGNIYNIYSRGQINAYTPQNHYHFFTSSPALTNGATVNNELCYTATHTATGVVSQRGFYSTINGNNSWQLYMGGTAPNYIEGKVGIGISNPTNKLQVENGHVVFNDSGGNFDFRVEGDTDPNLLFTDASTDRIGIGRNDPEYLLDIGSNADNSIMRVNTIRLRDYLNITNGDNSNATTSIMGSMYSPLGIGYGTAPTTDRSITYATNYFSNPGDAQKISMVVQHETTNSTPAYLNAAKTGSYLYSTYVRNDTFLLPINSSATFTMHIIANNNTDDTSAGWIIRGCVKSVDRSLSFVGSPSIDTFSDSGMLSASAQVEVQNGSGISAFRMGGLLVKVTGISGNTIRWVCTIDAVITSF